MKTLRKAPLALGIAASLLPFCALAQSQPQDVAAQIRALNARLEAQEHTIGELKSQVETLQLEQIRGRGISSAYAVQSAPQPMPADGSGATRPPQAQSAPAGQTIGEEQQRAAQDERAKDRALTVREHAPLFERKFSLDIGGSYSYYDRRQLALSGFLALDAIFLGSINLDQVKANTFTIDATGRFGLTPRLSLEANVPYVIRSTRFISGGAGGASSKLSEETVTSKGIGDASVAAYYQFVKESQRWPDIVGSVRVRIPTGDSPFGIKLVQPDSNNNNLNIPDALPTGTGMYSVTAGVSALRTYDPVILFANLAYTYNIGRKFDDISPVLGQTVPATVYMGNPIQLSAGMALALNDRAALSFSVAMAQSGATHIKDANGNKSRVVGSSSNAATFNVGGTYVLPSGWTINGQAVVGLSPDAPNYVLGVRATRAF
jgi:hypothetical protein